MEFGKLKPGQSFGGRSLVSLEFYKNVKTSTHGYGATQPRFKVGTSEKEMEKYRQAQSTDPDSHLTKSLMSVVADSANVEIWTLDKQSLGTSMIENAFTIDEAAHKQITEQIVNCVDPDRGHYFEPDVQHIKNQYEKWDRYKQEQVEDIFQHQEYSKYMLKW